MYQIIFCFVGVGIFLQVVSHVGFGEDVTYFVAADAG